LSNLLKKDSFLWDIQAVAAFETLKIAIMKAHVLALPDFLKTFILETDDSGLGVGVALSQNGHPITFSQKIGY